MPSWSTVTLRASPAQGLRPPSVGVRGAMFKFVPATYEYCLPPPPSLSPCGRPRPLCFPTAAVYSQALSNIRTVRQFSAEFRERDRYSEKVHSTRDFLRMMLPTNSCHFSICPVVVLCCHEPSRWQIFRVRNVAPITHAPCQHQHQLLCTPSEEFTCRREGVYRLDR